MKRKWLYVLIGIAIPFALLCIIVIATPVAQDMLYRLRWHRAEEQLDDYLESLDYTDITYNGATMWEPIADGHAEAADELYIGCDSTRFTSDTIADALLLKNGVETYLTEHLDVFPTVRIEIVIDDPYDSCPHHIRIANFYKDFEYSSDDYTNLAYGYFDVADGSIADLEGGADFKYLVMDGLSMESQLTVLNSMPDLHYLKIITNETLDEAALQDLMQARPNCTIIINGRTVQQGE